ncbi:type III PLP-dependent enzyme domain-containing protein [Tropicibacter oceani]|uniref:Orn/DAP/Arg decarboxylase 2 N-terminal domain-containing protein n=1 Tax=Tropicibacter oceani TaxID=3058420 RepID=A0ABY8QIQ1_9RHOB|nr:hypothetical protein [Tropicibacter oceani]WGW04520.1 hypothetical protein QF118_02925 [Tropicibacter oceani]
MSLTADQIDNAARLAGTPLYAYSAPALRDRVQQLRKAIPEAGFVYSLKANPNLSIVQCLTGQGIGTEVCSLFELETSLAAGVPAQATIFVGPAKSPREIRRAIAVGIKAIIAESLEELGLIDTIAAEMGVVQPVALRINPSFHTRGAKLSMSGKPTQFGIGDEDIDGALALIAEARQIRLVGLHVYMGTRILDHQVVAENTRNVLALADDIIARAGHGLEFVDIGGGWGVPYAADETALDFPALAEAVNTMAAAWKTRHRGTQIIIELGRYLVAEAGVFVTAVRYVKSSKGVRFAVCDGGANLHGAAGQAAGFRRNFPIRALHPRPGDTAPWNVSGPLCTPMDVIGQKVDLPPVQPGDLLCIDRSGAYGLTASPAQFLSFASPAEVLVDGPRITQIRAPGTLAAHLAQFTPAELTPLADAPKTLQTAEV